MLLIQSKKMHIGIMMILVLLITYIFIISRPHPKNDFISDGCSMWPDYWHYECCYAHDKKYWEGGTAKERLNADIKFKQCVAEISSTFIGGIMYYTVRISGHPMWPMPWRWDFGQAYVGRYLEEK